MNNVFGLIMYTNVTAARRMDVCWCTVPSAPPSNIHATMVDNTTMYLTWEPPPAQHLNGPLRGYKVDYTQSIVTTYIYIHLRARPWRGFGGFNTHLPPGYPWYSDKAHENLLDRLHTPIGIRSITKAFDRLIARGADPYGTRGHVPPIF